MTGELRLFRRRRLSPEEGRDAAQRILAMLIPEQVEKAAEFHLDDPETLLPLLEALRDRWAAHPLAVLEEAEFLYAFLEKLDPQYPHDAFLLDELQYFLGETARIAGTVCRALSKREEARRWFDRSEGWFRLTENAAANLSKVAYQRLALRTEQRDFDAVLELLPPLIESFRSCGMAEDALKCRFLEGQVLKETERLDEAAVLFSEICREANTLGNGTLLGSGYVNLLQIHAFQGDAEKAFDVAVEATPLLRSLDNRMDLAKLQLGLAFLLRNQGKPTEAFEAYRVAQREFAELGMRADIAAIQLVVADLLLEVGQDRQAEWEVRSALPVIDELKLVPEGIAALSLLRDSLRRHQIDRKALRDLHGLSREPQG